MKKNSFSPTFTKDLLKWNQFDNNRSMPWKGEKDPYKIWLSEIILQQTRVEQGLAYYNRFIKQFPTVHHLAKAKDDVVFKLWEGLGYYTRCKNLIQTARFISKELNGKFPDKYDDILKLKGIGPYTAAAIGSFAFNLPHAVVDGNVFRVLSRYFGIKTPVDSNEGKKKFTELANELLDKQNPGIYNQALMDFGAVVCKPQLPLCEICPLKAACVANLKGIVNELPVKENKLVKKTRWFFYVIIEHNGNVYVKKRTGKDIWENLYEFVLHEHLNTPSAKDIKELAFIKKIIGKLSYELVDVSKTYKQQLSHQTIHGNFIRIQISKPLSLDGYEIVSKKKMKLLAFPRFINSYLENVDFE